MRLIFAITTLIILSTVLPVLASSPNPIEPILEENRVLLVFAPSRTDQNYLEIKNDLAANEDGIQNRDMQVVYVFPSEIATFPEFGKLDSQDPALLRDAYNADIEDFKTVLIDRNGDVKIDSDKSVAVSKIFEHVDKSPIRKVEMFLPNDNEDHEGTTIL